MRATHAWNIVIACRRYGKCLEVHGDAEAMRVIMAEIPCKK